MKTIRENVFETNSSSTHSISFSKNKTMNIDYSLLENVINGEILVIDGYYDFGWGPDKYNDSMTKIVYYLLNYGYLSYRIWDESEPTEGDLELDRELEEIIINTIQNRFPQIKKIIFNIDKTSTISNHNCGRRVISNIDDFIFNLDTWLFIDNDNSDRNADFYIVSSDRPDYILIINPEDKNNCIIFDQLMNLRPRYVRSIVDMLLEKYTFDGDRKLQKITPETKTFWYFNKVNSILCTTINDSIKTSVEIFFKIYKKENLYEYDGSIDLKKDSIIIDKNRNLLSDNKTYEHFMSTFNFENAYLDYLRKSEYTEINDNYNIFNINDKQYLLDISKDVDYEDYDD